MHTERRCRQAAIDTEALFDRVEGDRELLRELAELYLADQPVRLTEICEALAAADAPRLAKAAHTLKGAVANFCAADAECAASELEQLARDSNLPAAPRACARLERILVQLEVELRRLALPSPRTAAETCP